MNPVILNSWKEVAAYLGRGVRTAQRWEHDLGLPVHHQGGTRHSAVAAIPEELDGWLHRTPLHIGEKMRRSDTVPVVRPAIRRSLETMARLRLELHAITNEEQKSVYKLYSTLRTAMPKDRGDVPR